MKEQGMEMTRAASLTNTPWEAEWGFPEGEQKDPVFVVYGFRSKLPQTRWLTTV